MGAAGQFPAGATPDSKVKIFGIGLAKTGTLSLATALRALGWRAVHDHRVCQGISDAISAGLRPAAVGMADAFCDWPHPLDTFAKLAELFPESRFILTVRDLESWVRSRLLHVLHSRVTGENGWGEADTREWVREYVVLEAAFIEWLLRHPGRGLLFDVRNGWEPICAFLGVAQPSVPFPRENGGARRVREILAYFDGAERGA